MTKEEEKFQRAKKLWWEKLDNRKIHNKNMEKKYDN